MINTHKATANYERWMASQIRLVKEDLAFKHKQMRASAFHYFRATFYRWLQLWEATCPEEGRVPRLLAVGDLHIENFGTWRDCEGRLIWGINDFDEAYPMPYTIDLVRLATSAHLALEDEHLEVRPREACDALLEGYQEGLESGGEPFVLGENHKWLRLIALNRLRDPVRFWRRMEDLPRFRGAMPAGVRRELEADLPDAGLGYIRKKRVAGLGSLGHLRVLALTKWRGGWVAREAKALTPSACVWAANTSHSAKLLYSEIIGRAVRVPDPYLRIVDRLLLRRLAPDCCRILLASLPRDRDEARLLFSMGFETANVHLGSRETASTVLRDLRKRPGKWLHRAAKKMAKAVRRDWKDWCES